MNDIEQRARELLAAEYVKEGRMASAQETMSGHDLHAHAEYIAIRAIVAALSQQQAVPEDVQRDAELWRLANGMHAFNSSELRCHVNVGINEWRNGEWIGFDQCSVDELKEVLAAQPQAKQVQP